MPTPLYLRLSGFYLLYFATLGVVVPYWSLYLRGLGFEAARIGELIAITLATKLVAPYVWGALADRRGERMPVVRGACMAAAVCFAGVFVAGDSYWGLAVVLLAFSFFWNAALPQFEATTLNHLGAQSHRYARVRLWGSLGFIATVVAVGPLLAVFGTGAVPLILQGQLLLLWAMSRCVPEGHASAPLQSAVALRGVLARPAVWSLLAICLLVQVSHGPYYAFFSIYLEQTGYARGAIGALWGIGVLAEVAVFVCMHRWLPRFGARRLMLLTLGLTTLRWVMLAWGVASLPVLVVAQTLHAFSFGVYHAVAIHLIHRHFTGRLQGRGQALYASLSFGAGGSLGSLGAGYLWLDWGGDTYLLAAAAAALALTLAWWRLRDEEGHGADRADPG